MKNARVRALRAVELGVTDTDKASRFLEKTWNLAPVATAGGTSYFRGTGPFRWITSIRPARETGLVRVVFDAADKATLEALHTQVAAAGAREVQPIKRLDWPGGGAGFGFKDPDGRTYAIVCDVADHADGAEQPDRPSRISHVNLQCPDGDATFAFLRDGLGLRLTEQSRPMWFLRCNSDHSCIVLSRHARPTLNHIAYQMPGWEHVMRGIGRMKDHGYQLGWGPGRHGPGDAVFAYFIAHEDLPLEYTAEQIQVDDETHVPMPIEHWKWPEGRLDHWGLMPGPSPAFQALKDRFAFSTGGHIL